PHRPRPAPPGAPSHGADGRADRRGRPRRGPDRDGGRVPHGSSDGRRNARRPAFPGAGGPRRDRPHADPGDRAAQARAGGGGAPMRAMILAAGLGTRLRPITDSVAKPMVPVLNRPVMERILALLARHGFTEVIANLHWF